MKRWLCLVGVMALMMCGAGLAETPAAGYSTPGEDPFAAEAPAAVAGEDPFAVEAEALTTAAPANLDADAGRELSRWFGGDIAQAAAEIGGLTHESSDEFADSYLGDGLALHGNGGVVTFVDLRPENLTDTLCGIQNGMTRADAQSLMTGCPLMWDYEEELCWLIRADAQDELRDEILVVFFDEDARVAGAWYRVAGV